MLIAVKYLPGAMKLCFESGGAVPSINFTAYWNSVHGRGGFSDSGGQITGPPGGGGGAEAEAARRLEDFGARVRFGVFMVGGYGGRLLGGFSNWGSTSSQDSPS